MARGHVGAVDGRQGGDLGQIVTVLFFEIQKVSEYQNFVVYLIENLYGN